MKFNIDDKVIFDGNIGIVYDYNKRYKTYTVEINGKRYWGIPEDNLQLSGSLEEA